MGYMTGMKVNANKSCFRVSRSKQTETQAHATAKL